MTLNEHFIKLYARDYRPRVIERYSLEVNRYVFYAWTPTWEGQKRSEYSAARADLVKHLEGVIPKVQPIF